MWIRFRFDICWSHVGIAWCYSLLPGSRSVAEQQALTTWGNAEQSLLTLSVRSAFDLLLRSLKLPQGSEVLMTALTVPDMIELVKQHGLVPVPVDITPHGEMDLASLQSQLTPNARMLVVAHLFGNRCELSHIIPLLQKHNILLVEDCAQSFTAVGEPGHVASDVVMHSFGPIKTATAFGGAVIHIANATLHANMRELLQQDPLQTQWEWLKRLAWFTLLKGLSSYAISNLLFLVTQCLRINVDRFLNSLGKSFHSRNLLTQIRKQPATSLLKFMAYRWQNYDFSRIRRRIQLGKQLSEMLNCEHLPHNSYWVFPIFHAQANSIVQKLRAAGFDATSHSRMAIVPANNAVLRPSTTAQFWSQIIFLPWYVELPANAVERMGKILQEFQNKND
jgi:perosamine synthetase